MTVHRERETRANAGSYGGHLEVHFCFYQAADTYCKINQMKFSHADMLVSIHTLLTALDGDGEDSVRTGAVFIHVCGTNRP